MHPPPIESPAEALRAVSRLLAASRDHAGPQAVGRTLVREARTLFAAEGVALVAVEPADRTVALEAADPAPTHPTRTLDLHALAPVAELVAQRGTASVVTGLDAAMVPIRLGLDGAPGAVLALALRQREAIDHVLLVWPGPDVLAFDRDVVESGVAFAAAAAGAMAQLRLAAEEARRSAQQAALTRAAQSLHGSLDLPTTLAAITREAQHILGADLTAVYRVDGDALVIDSTTGLPPEARTHRMPLGTGLAGRVAQSGRPMLTNDYERIAQPAPGTPFAEVHAALAVPMRFDGGLRGVVSAGFRRDHHVRFTDLALLEAFAELAAAACRNAAAHAGALHSARTDSLTGCLNHATLMDGLAREIERSTRTGHALSLIALDLDDFKEVNERGGHLVGDDVLRRVGHALRLSTRPYDLVARHGGDEFAIVALGASEREATDLAGRALRHVEHALLDLPAGTRATAGVATWSRGQSVDDLLGRADAALLHAKHTGLRGCAVAASQVPDTGTSPAVGTRRRPVAPRALTSAGAHADRLQRRTRQLALIGAMGSRLAGMTDVTAICDAVADELHRAFGFFLCAVVEARDDGFVEAVGVRGPAFERLGERNWSQPREAGLIGRCLRERAVVLVDDVRTEPEYTDTPETSDVRAELVAPIVVGDRLWGVLNVEETRVGAFDEDDAQALRSVAEQVGAALRSALLYAQLEAAYIGTAEALAAALAAKDAHTAAHSRDTARWAEEVGRRVGLPPDALRDLRYGAIFHDIGKIAVPEAILHKPGPLDELERAVVEGHTVAGEQILAPVAFLEGVLPLVRHEHERYDGRGYPDGLAAEEIPLGARIIFACDAYHAMTSDRPYRSALSHAEALGELRAGAGSQFDPDVVDALLAVLGDEDAAAPAAA